MQQYDSTCDATMLRDKLKKNFARITGPLWITFEKSMNSSYGPFSKMYCLTVRKDPREKYYCVTSFAHFIYLFTLHLLIQKYATAFK